MTYNSLVSAIPNEWKIKKKSVNMTDRLTDDIRLTCNNVLVSLEKITSKKLYNELIRRTAKLPIAIESWTELYPFLENHDWKCTPLFCHIKLFKKLTFKVFSIK